MLCLLFEIGTLPNVLKNTFRSQIFQSWIRRIKWKSMRNQWNSHLLVRLNSLDKPELASSLVSDVSFESSMSFNIWLLFSDDDERLSLSLSYLSRTDKRFLKEASIWVESKLKITYFNTFFNLKHLKWLPVIGSWIKGATVSLEGDATPRFRSTSLRLAADVDEQPKS